MSPDTVLWELEELGEEVPAVLQHLKERVKLAQARMKELRLTEGEVVRAAQRISASVTASGAQPHTSRDACQPHTSTSHPQPSIQPPKLALSRSQTLLDKTQLTLVGMAEHHASAPTPAVPHVASLDKYQTEKPPCQTFSLDKAHLLALWRCALPLARMEEVLGMLDIVFTQRESQVAKATLAHASRHRLSPRTTPSRRQTRAMCCITPTSSWNVWPTTHTPTTPHRDSKQPSTPHSDSKQSVTSHSSSWLSVTPQSISQQSVTPHGASQQSVTSHSASQLSVTPQHSATPYRATRQSVTPQSRSCRPTTPYSDTWESETPCSESFHSVTPHSKQCQPSTLHSDLQQPDTQQNQSVVFAKLDSGSYWSGTACSESHHLTTSKSEVQQSAVTTRHTTSCVAATEVSTYVVLVVW